MMGVNFKKENDFKTVVFPNSISIFKNERMLGCKKIYEANCN